ncbi:hypothetical protein PLEOSDRAFT_158846 [Pleurotus ostreatus PC15]|uniref:Uncharacterized protein n=1 Tax=Pleurotus ostreatus (strain PC15) TaxID=1137138 RepID=A0A067NUI8_PLEO1|nr:hypothetical protein PLEOSDRAFT_158846 [Pleurotus ostreatus PC15]
MLRPTNLPPSNASMAILQRTTLYSTVIPSAYPCLAPVGSTRYDNIFYGLRDACISSAARALGYVYADNAKWEFARYP